MTHAPIEDLVDFYRRWPDLRPLATQAATTAALDEDQQMVLRWMIAVVDRVGPIDIARENKDDGRI